MSPPATATIAGPRSAPTIDRLGQGAGSRTTAPTPPIPAVPAAVILPPVVTYVVSILIVTGVHALLTEAPSTWTLLRAGTLASLLAPVLYAVRVIHRTRGGRAGSLLLPVSATLVALLIDLVLPGEMFHPFTMASLVICGLLLHPVATAWREWWIRFRPMRATLLAPDEETAASAIHALQDIPGLTITSAILPDCNEPIAADALRIPVRRTLNGLFPIEKRIIVHRPTRDHQVGSYIAQLVSRGHGITSKSQMMRNAEGRIDTNRADPLNLLLARPCNRATNAASRLMDIALSFAALVLLAPLMAIIAILVRIDSPGPALFRQERMGVGGRRFPVLKFRSMRQDAEAKSGPVWATEQDPRTTRVGAFLRNYRLDELPQFFNVLVGQMALVGPRPERAHFCEELREELPLFDLRAAVRPGITGWAQIRAPYAGTSDETRTKLGFDLFYVTRRSPWFDLAILFETLGVALSGQGAR